MDIESKFAEKLKHSEPKTSGWNLLNLQIGVKKRLEEVSSDNKDIKEIFGLSEFQRIFERILHDMKDDNHWNDLSLDMLICSNCNVTSTRCG